MVGSESKKYIRESAGEQAEYRCLENKPQETLATSLSLNQLSLLIFQESTEMEFLKFASLPIILIIDVSIC